ncbi:MAG: YsnF/AvaK domain-containing protein [Syntrophomonadaceae bacterium]|nr:YsnF/AvaK domain-containing protein [Syntrophomonadaceae bacterium]
MSWFSQMFGTGDKADDQGREEALEHEKSGDVNEQSLKLRKEELDIAKNRVDIGKVEVGKEIVEERQTIHVPVSHDEVIIVRKTINEPSDRPIGEDDEGHFSMSVGEERVEVGKHTVVTGEVSARKREVEEEREVTGTVRHEEARISKDGDARIVDDHEQLS